MKKYTVKKHYDRLISENDDPVNDPPELKAYMNGWDGEFFIEKMSLSPEKNVLEIGVGTGRLAVRICRLCKTFTGIDISPLTVRRAIRNLSEFHNAQVFCGNFLRYPFCEKFDLIYSSLTFFHIRRKLSAFKKVYRLLHENGRFLLSVDKSGDRLIDCGVYAVPLYPDSPEKTEARLKKAGFSALEKFETEKSFIFLAQK